MYCQKISNLPIVFTSYLMLAIVSALSLSTCNLVWRLDEFERIRKLVERWHLSLHRRYVTIKFILYPQIQKYMKILSFLVSLHTCIQILLTAYKLFWLNFDMSIIGRFLTAALKLPTFLLDKFWSLFKLFSLSLISLLKSINTNLFESRKLYLL